MHDRHGWLLAVCNMAAGSPDLLQAIGVGLLLGFACMVVRLYGHADGMLGVVGGSGKLQMKADTVGRCDGTVE
jgi:hypothetical protein